MALPPYLKRFRSEDITVWSFLLFLVAVALTGGSARATSFGQVCALVAATIASAAWLAFVRPSNDRRLSWGFAFLGACAAVTCLQLVPLPPAWWRALPGRQAYVAAAVAAGVDDVWRPLSVAPDLTWAGLFALLVPTAVLIGMNCLSSRRRAGLMIPVAALIFASGIFGLAQVTGGPNSSLRWYGGNPDPSAVGFMANRNHQALLLACALPILAALASVSATHPKNNATRRWGALGVGGFIVLMVPTTGSRAGLVLGGLAIVLALAIAAPAMSQRLRKMRRRQRRQVLAIGAGVILIFASVLVFLGRNVAFTRIATLDPLTDLRLRAFPVVMDMMRTFLPWGSGIGTFEPLFRHFEPFDLLKPTYYNQAHNDIVQVVLEGGVAGAILLVAFVLWWIVATVRAWRAETSVQALAARAGSAIILLCLLASIVDYPLRTSLILAVFCIATVWLLTPMPNRAGTGNQG